MSGSSRVIFSVYKEVSDSSVTDYKKQQLKEYKESLIQRQHKYAQFCNADYFVYENNNQVTDEYNSIQFFKIQQLEILANKYKEVLYLDLDVIPFKFINFFEEHDLSKLCCLQQDCEEWGLKRYFSKYKDRYLHFDVLDSQNWWVKACAKNSMLLLDDVFKFNNNIINTGVLGGSSEVIKQLQFTSKLDSMIKLLYEAKDDNVYPEEIKKLIQPNNEVFLTYLIEKNNILLNEIGINWNYILDDLNKDFVWEEPIFIHCINKEFERYNKIFNLF